MKISLRSWNLSVIFAFVFGGLGVAAFNYYVDPYEIFNQPYLRSGYSVNERYRKVEHLLNIEQHYDGFIMGSSVMGLFDPAHASLDSGLSYYNLSFLAGTPHEALQTLRALKTKEILPKEILFGLDFFTFYELDKATTPLTTMHPLVTGASRTSFYLDYLFSSGLWQGLSRIEHHLAKQPDIFFNVDGDGTYRLYGYERRIKDDHDAFIKSKFAPSTPTAANVIWVPERFAEFEAFSHWLDDNKIHARFFIHPLYKDSLNTVSSKSYGEFVSRVRAIRSDVVDFSGTDCVTHNPFWYYDKHHYQPVVANKIMDVLFMPNGKRVKLEDLCNE